MCVALKKPVLFQKYFKEIIMQLFSEDAIVFSKKINPQKLLIIGPNIFLCTGPAVQKVQKLKSRTTKSPLMQDWGFRLGIRERKMPIKSSQTCHDMATNLITLSEWGSLILSFRIM